MYAAGFRGQNIPEPLYAMRDDRNAYSRRKFKYRVNEFCVRIQAAHILRLPFRAYLYAWRPLLISILPSRLYCLLHKSRLDINA